jgi:hypothetical protein
VANGNAAGRILLGTAGWDRSDWLDAYYPPDLPAEWRLAYYANECNCVLLPATGWCGTDCERLGLAFAEAPEYLTVFLELSLDCRPEDCCDPDIFAPNRVVLLVQRPETRFARYAQWVARGPDVWVDRDSVDTLVRWEVDRSDLRELRERVAGLPADAAALVLDGPAAQPGSVPELRVLLELMGRG